MQRYFVPSIQGASVDIVGDDAHHIVRVMRMRIGQALIVCDGAQAWDGVIDLVAQSFVRVRLCGVRTEHPEPRIPLWVAQALPKSDKMDVVVQKATELGTCALFPFVSARSIVRTGDATRHERWQRIAKEASEQSGRLRIPVVHRIQSLDDVCALFGQCARVLWCTLDASESVFHAMNTTVHDAPILVVVGPEGGFAPEETAQAVDAGALPVSLGPRVLRAETAALMVLSAWHAIDALRMDEADRGRNV